MSQLFRNLLRGVGDAFCFNFRFFRELVNITCSVTGRVAKVDAVVYKPRCQTFILSLKMAA